MSREVVPQPAALAHCSAFTEERPHASSAFFGSAPLQNRLAQHARRLIVVLSIISDFDP